MPKITKTIALNTNMDKLLEDVFAQYPNAVYRRAETVFEVEHPSANSAAMDTLIAAHNPVTLTTEQTKAVARTLMLSNAKNFLSNQLAAPQWNAAKLTEVYTTVKSYVDSNPTLGQMVANQITLCSNSLTWVLNLITPTAVDRQRYLFCVQLVLATIA